MGQAHANRRAGGPGASTDTAIPGKFYLILLYVVVIWNFRELNELLVLNNFRALILLCNS